MEPIKIEIVSTTEPQADKKSEYRKIMIPSLFALGGVIVGALIGVAVSIHNNNDNTNLEKTKFYYADVTRKQDITFEVDSSLNDIGQDLKERITFCNSIYQKDLQSNLLHLHLRLDAHIANFEKSVDKFFFINNIDTYQSEHPREKPENPVTKLINYLEKGEGYFESCTSDSFLYLSETNYTTLKKSTQTLMKNLGNKTFNPDITKSTQIAQRYNFISQNIPPAKNKN